MANEEWTKVKKPAGNYFKMEQPGDSIEGIYLGTTEGSYEGEPTTQHNFELADGAKKYISGTKVLNELLAAVTVGTKTKVIYESDIKKKTGKGTFRNFDVLTPKAQQTA